MLSVYQAEGNNKCKEQMYNESRMYTAPLHSQCIPTGAKKICCSVILGQLESFRNYKGFSIIFPKILAAI